MPEVCEGDYLPVSTGSSSSAGGYLTALFCAGTLSRKGDSELLEQFIAASSEQDESAELAFSVLLARHGSMVLKVCRGVLGDDHQAEDAFQATFLILASRARSIRRQASVASWLHGVALKVAATERSRSCAEDATRAETRRDGSRDERKRAARSRGGSCACTRRSGCCRSDTARRWCCAIWKA